jgi:hypothetical protein
LVLATGSCWLTADLSALSSAPEKAYRDEVLFDHPVAYWRLGEKKTDTVAIDQIAGHNGEYVGGLERGVSGAIQGDPDTAVRFLGQNGTIQFGSLFDLAGAAFSIEAWVSAEPFSSSPRYDERYILSKWDTGAGTGYHMYVYGPWVDKNNVAQPPGLGVDLCAARNCTSLTVPTPDHFAHVVFTSDTRTWRLYVDGVEASHTTSTAQPTATSIPFTIASGTWGGGQVAYFPGTLDEIALYDHELPPDRIRAHFAASQAH